MHLYTCLNYMQIKNKHIINGEAITSFFRQISHPKMAVTGGYVGYLDSVVYLAGGQYFEGRYNPMGPDHGPGFTQEYTNEIRKFKIEDEKGLRFFLLLNLTKIKHH